MNTLRLSKSIFFIVLVSLLVQSVNSQTIIHKPEIDIITYSKYGDFMLYHKISDNQYNLIEADIKTELDENRTVLGRFHKFETDKDDVYTYSEIIESNDYVVNKADIKKQTLQEFQSFITSNIWSVPAEVYNGPVVLKAINKNIISEALLRYEKSQIGGFGVYEKDEERHIKKWRPYNVKFYTITYIEIASNTFFAVFNNNYDYKGIMIQLQNNDVVATDLMSSEKHYNLPANDSLTKIGFKELIYYNNYDINYELKQVGNNKVTLVNSFGDRLIEKDFDDVSFSPYFVYGREGLNFTIYNYKLEEVNLGNIKSATIYRSGIEVLDEEGPSYYNYNLEKTLAFPPLIVSYCGTVPHKNYSLEYKKNAKIPHSLIFEEGHFGQDDFEDVFYLKGLNNNQKVTFIDDRLYQSTDSNTSFKSYTNLPVNLIKVEEEGKVGLMDYDLENVKIYKDEPEIKKPKPSNNNGKLKPPPPEPIIPSLRSKKGSVQVSEILPIKFDSIVYRQQDTQVYLYQNNKMGLYPLQREAIYDSIQQKTNSFYYFVKDGQKGYLNRKTGIEYLLD